MPRTTGTFTVKLGPLDTYGSQDPSLSHRALDKVFSGALAGTSVGEMLACMGTVKGSAGYVAMERVSGSLDGKTGTFALQHSSTMNRGTPTQSITVVPDSATEDLVGLRGSMTIDITDNVHAYIFNYEIVDLL